MLAALAAGHTHVALDGTLIRTDRSKAAGPTAKVDLWWSGKHHHHGGNVQVVTAPDGWPLSHGRVRPGREHDVTCARTHSGLLDALTAWSDSEHLVLADRGYLGEADRLTCPIKKPSKLARLSVEQRTVNAMHSATRALAERGNALLKTTFKALRRVSLCPLADRCDHRRRADLAPHRARPNHMIKSLLGNAQWALRGGRARGPRRHRPAVAAGGCGRRVARQLPRTVVGADRRGRCRWPT